MNYRALLWLCSPQVCAHGRPTWCSSWLPGACLPLSWIILSIWDSGISRLISWACCQSLHKALASGFPLGGWPTMLLVGIPVSLIGGHGGGCLWGWGVDVRIGVSTCIHMQVPSQSRRETGGKGRREGWLFLCCHVQDYKFEFSLPGYY